jgi:hypothetical protein
VAVRYTDAILGASVEVATIHGAAQLPVPPGTQAGQRLTLPGAGIAPPAAAAGPPGEGALCHGGMSETRPGDHHYIVVVLLPEQARRSFWGFFGCKRARSAQVLVSKVARSLAN